VAAVVGHVTSGAMLAAAPVYRDSGLVSVSPSATSPDITRAGDWTFRVCPSDLEHGPALAEWLLGQLGRSRPAVLYANDAYGRGVLGSFADSFEGGGGTIVSRDPFLPVTTQDSTAVEPYIERAMARSADAIVIAGFADEAAAIIRAARRLGFGGPILGGEGLLGVEEAGAVTEGVYVSAPFLPDVTGATTADWVAAYGERYGTPPDAFAALTYDALRLVAAAIAGAGPDRTAIRDWLAEVGSSRAAFEGITGTIAFDANGDVPDKGVTIGRIQRGQVRTVGGG
jgi:branched-chain amino acid transport system substrate-binding protein